jgi:hypothetical protein
MKLTASGDYRQQFPGGRSGGVRSEVAVQSSPVGAVLLPMPTTTVIARGQPASDLCDPSTSAESQPLGLVITLFRRQECGPLYEIALHRRPRETR